MDSAEGTLVIHLVLTTCSKCCMASSIVFNMVHQIIIKNNFLSHYNLTFFFIVVDFIIVERCG